MKKLGYLQVGASTPDPSASRTERDGAPEGQSTNCPSTACVTLRSQLKKAGIPAAVVMELIGHDSAQMSEHYTHVGQEATGKQAEPLPKALIATKE